MFVVNNRPILADMQEILSALKVSLAANGVDRFRTIRPSGKDIMTNCPFHSGGQERRPSFGIQVDTGVCHCFACGWAGTIAEVISLLHGYDDYGKFGERWLIKNFFSVEVEDRKGIDLSNMRRGSAAVRQTYVSEKELDSYRYTHPYMYQRGLTDELIERFDIGYDKRTDCITFPVKDLTGNVVFVARRSVSKKFFNYPEDVVKPVYAAWDILQLDPIPTKVVICESFFNALTCWKYGIPAVALLGTGAENQYKILKELPIRKYVIGTDPDDAGERGYQKLKQRLQDSKIITRYVIPKGKDLNDLDKEVLNLSEIF